MSVHSHQAAVHDAAIPEFPRHVVTAVLVSHDGARWLPHTLAGLLGQERPVQNVLAADTGSADDSARLVTEAVGAERVFHLARRTGFGQAVDEVVRMAPVLTPDELTYLRRPSAWDPVTRTWRDDTYDLPDLPYGEPVQWLWLLHDDCAPEPDALAQLLDVVEREAEAGREVAVVGPKLRGWYDRRQLLEVGVSIANSGRRWTGLDRREQDQGQHDQVRPVLSVSSAGMLIRRDVYEELGGFDRRLPLMRDDVDLCWRAHSAGHQVLVAPDAVCRHAEAASRERRAVDCVGRTSASPHKVDKAGAVYTLLVNSRGGALPWVFLRLVLGTLVRTLGHLLGKVPGQALDEMRGLMSVLLRPGRVLSGRRRRRAPQVGKDELRPLFPPRGATIRATLEQAASSISGRTDPELTTGAGRHGGAVESGPGGDDADFLEVEQFARLKRIARNPGPMLFLVLLLVSLLACRNLLGSGALGGGAMLPAPADAGQLWSRYLDAWHPVGAGGTASAPPYLALVALLATLLGGSTGLAVTVLLVASVPLAGFIAYFASRPLAESRLLRAWAAVAYSFLPAVTGALAGGRIGTAVLAMLLPLLARAGIAASGLANSSERRGSWRATWAYALLLTITTAFTPIVWPVALVLGVALLAVRRRDLPAYGLRLVVQLATPLLVLAPWSLSLLPFGFFHEAGLSYGGSASALDLLGTGPGGPGTIGGPLLIGFVLAALAALLRTERRRSILTAWAVALVGLVFAALSNASTWAGPATLVYGLALLTAAVVGADGARARVAEQSFGWRQPVAALIVLACAVGPLAAAAHWVFDGADGPLERRDPVQVPAFVAEESGTRDQARTLVLDSDSESHVGYTLVRGSGARLGDADIADAQGDNRRLDKVVANLVAGSGADQTEQLGGFAVRYILVHKGAPREITRVLDATPGLSRLSQQDGTGLWRLDREVSRASIVTKGAAPRPVAARAVDIHTTIPAGAEGRVLRLADTADAGWTATLDGQPLSRTTVDGWAQGFELPATGGRLDVTHTAPGTHTVWLGVQGLLAVVLVVLALPGRRRDVDDDMPDEPMPFSAQPVEGEGRRARRLRAQAEAEAAAQAADGTADGTAGDGVTPDGEDPEQETPNPPAPDEAPATVPHQQEAFEDSYGAAAYEEGWAQTPAPSGNVQDGTYADGYRHGTYQEGGVPQEAAYQDAAYQDGGYQDGTYPAGAYAQQYPSDAYGDGTYDPYAYGGDPASVPPPGTGYDQTYTQGYDATYDPAQPNPQGTGSSERPDGSHQ